MPVKWTTDKYKYKEKVFINNLKKYNKSWFVIPLFAVAIVGILLINKCSGKEKNVKSNSELLDNKSLQNAIKKPLQKTKSFTYFNMRNKSKIFSPSSLKI